MGLKWTDSIEIAIQLEELYPNEDNLNLRFTDLHKWVVGLKDFDALEQISSTAEKLSAGEILQIEKSITRSMTEDVYFEMISQKTASLIATSCELGAITTTKKEKDRQATFSFGENLGMAFQIKEDLFDLLGNENDTGKNNGGDVKRNMATLPLIFSKNINNLRYCF